jgi:hypothetical protein
MRWAKRCLDLAMIAFVAFYIADNTYDDARGYNYTSVKG